MATPETRGEIKKILNEIKDLQTLLNHESNEKSV
jgi:hypothetical protein